MRSFVAISDIHFNLQNIEPASVVLRQALQEARERKCPLLIGGDLNDTKAILRGEVIKRLMIIFDEFNDVNVYILIGNHDLINHNSKDHSLEFLRLMKSVHIVDYFGSIGPWGHIPYTHKKEKFLEYIAQQRKGGVKYLLVHQGVQGALMSEYAIDDSSVTIDAFAGFDLVLSGHYHMHQWYGENFMYFGSPYTTRSDEAAQKKYIWYISLDPKRTIESIATKARRHYQFEFDGEAKWPDRVPADSIVKLVVKGDKAFCSSITKKLAQDNLGCESVTIVPIIQRQSVNRLQIDSSMGHMKVIDSYLERAATSMDKKELREYLTRIAK